MTKHRWMLQSLFFLVADWLTSMDIFDDIINTLQLKGLLYFRTNFSPPWGTTVPKHNNAARFHLVIQGRCFIQVNSGETIELSAGDLILVPNGASHILAHKPMQNAPPLETVLKDVGYTGDGFLAVGKGDVDASTQMVCGHFTFRNGADHPLLQALPDYIVVSTETRAKQRILDDTLNLISQHIFSENGGSTASITRLSEVVFIEILSSGVSLPPQSESILKAFRDPQIGRALQLIHSKLSFQWSVERLASEVAMSRSRFANRFSELMGAGPMSYLSDWRLQKGLSLIDDSPLSIKQIAEQTGYKSQSAFTRAFSARFGSSPTEYRR